MTREDMGYLRDLEAFGTWRAEAEEVLRRYTAKVAAGMYPTVALDLAWHDIGELYASEREATMTLAA